MMIHRIATGLACLSFSFVSLGCGEPAGVTDGGGNRLPDAVQKEVEAKNKESADMTPEQKMEQMRKSAPGAQK